MTENLKKFLEAVSQNEEERKVVSALKTNEEVIAYAKSNGFTLTEEDLEQSREELSDEELDAVAGGIYDTISCTDAGSGVWDNGACSCTGAGAGVEGLGYTPNGRGCGCSNGGYGCDGSNINCAGNSGDVTVDAASTYCTCFQMGSGQA